jgi:hypothetical protein
MRTGVKAAQVRLERHLSLLAALLLAAGCGDDGDTGRAHATDQTGTTASAGPSGGQCPGVGAVDRCISDDALPEGYTALQERETQPVTGIHDDLADALAQTGFAYADRFRDRENVSIERLDASYLDSWSLLKVTDWLTEPVEVTHVGFDGERAVPLRAPEDFDWMTDEGEAWAETNDEIADLVLTRIELTRGSWAAPVSEVDDLPDEQDRASLPGEVGEELAPPAIEERTGGGFVVTVYINAVHCQETEDISATSRVIERHRVEVDPGRGVADERVDVLADDLDGRVDICFVE